MSSCFYIGTREYMFEMRAPSINVPSSKNSFFNELNFINGGTSVRSSVAAHKRYDMTWNLIDRDEARILLDLADGIYGNGPIYWLDPIAADRNMLPQQMASPFQASIDGIPLNNGERPIRISTPNNSLFFPVFSARYDVTASNTKFVWVPIPPGHTAHIGVYGEDVSGGKMLAIPTTQSGAAVVSTELTLMSVTDDSRFNHTISASDGYNGFLLGLGGEGQITLTAAMVQVLEDGVTPETGGFISGQGHSGVRFVGQPVYTPYSAALDKVGVVASFAETGIWE
jgi:hypothetical protein